MAVGLRRTGGNRKRYETLLRKFAEQQASAVDTIQAALSAGDAATAERAAHSLKGAAATLGAISLSESAARAETAIKKGYSIDEAVSFLSLSLDRVVADLRTALAEDRSDNGAALRSSNPARVKELLIRLKQLLATDDGEAADFIIDAQSILVGVLTPIEMKMLSDRVGNFDFDAALNCLSRIASRLSVDLEAMP